MLFDKQYRFQLNNSTEHAILQLVNIISNSFERGEYTLGIFIDFSKAFDTVDHEILISKLQYYGTKGKTLKWLKSYLNERKQCISYSDVGKKKHVQYYLWRSLRFYSTISDKILWEF